MIKKNFEPNDLTFNEVNQALVSCYQIAPLDPGCWRVPTAAWRLGLHVGNKGKQDIKNVYLDVVKNNLKKKYRRNNVVVCMEREKIILDSFWIKALLVD